MLPITLEEMKAVKLMNRTDTKFVTNKRMLELLLSMVDSEYYIQVTGEKQIADYHTLYFDTDDCQMYLAHHNGRKTRQKLRIRSYVGSDLHFLEVKTKDNHGKTKKKRISLELSSFSGDQSMLSHELMQSRPIENHIDFLDATLWLKATDMVPMIENDFTRITLVNKKMT